MKSQNRTKLFINVRSSVRERILLIYRQQKKKYRKKVKNQNKLIQRKEINQRSQKNVRRPIKIQKENKYDFKSLIFLKFYKIRFDLSINYKMEENTID